MEKIDSSAPLVSVVIVNWDGLQDTKLCLKHTGDQSYPNIETVVVDNGSSDGSLNYLREHKGIKLVENDENLGFTGGHIAGFKVSNGEYILLLNNDAIMDSRYVENAVKTMQKDKNIGAVGGRAYLWDEQNKLFDTTNDFYSYQNINPITAEGIFARSDEGVLQEVNNVSGSCVMVRRSVIDKVGYLHNPFFAYYEESDLFARMKRAGYKIIYSPTLAIWHANAKSSSKKAPTFSLYMMMRNRFRFAVRNFDSWSLARFLKFYLKMGVVSIIKSFLPVKQRPMHRAYARAFLYNLVCGWLPILERLRLKKVLGPSNYNAQIVREQTGMSVVVVCDSSEQLDKARQLATSLSPVDEVIIVTAKPSIKKIYDGLKDSPFNLRLCVDRGFFNTHIDNLGAVCSKNNWIILADIDSSSFRDDMHYFSKNLYSVMRSGKKLVFITKASKPLRNLTEALNGEYSPQLMIDRELLIDEGGLDKNLSIEDAKRELIAYGFLAKSYAAFLVSRVQSTLPPYSGGLADHELHKKLSSKLHQAFMDHKNPSSLDKLAARYYRIAQFRSVFIWIFTPRIPARLKLGRAKSTLIALATLNRRRLATEIKHMRNEVLIYRNPHDLASIKKEENNKLSHLIEEPSDTPVFIILRDRYEPLKQLLKWLEAQDLKKIIFIDNDSKLPPLIDFLNETPYQVLELGRNMTQRAPWAAGIIKVLLPNDFYVVTDPDIVPTINNKGVLRYFYEVHKKFPNYLKIGFGLKTDDLPEKYTLKNDVIKWESQFWKNQLEENIYEAGIDTTFAVYKPRTYKYVLRPSIRTGGPYTARHLPWYSSEDSLTDEEVFYRLRADQSVNSWNKGQLPERYKKELAKQRH
ncbi:MAG: glycosyltransferase family 2 protein [Candidatus Levybacteria bacterium]|nr:glycosyltransferase family 2 protein [Candidatus Levybacteria bacterium]